MDQIIINWLLSVFGALLGFLLNAVWQAVKELQDGDKELATKISEIEVLVAGDYVKKGEFSSVVTALFKKLDRIEDKIDTKKDKE